MINDFTMDIDIKTVHIGKAIDRRRNELGLSKSEFGRRIGVPQQHVNRILERDTMETSKLLKVSEALDFNFFALFCAVSHKISAYLAAVTLNGNAKLVAQLSKEQAVVETQRETIKMLKEQIDNLNTQINRLDSNLKDKDVIIELLKERK